MDSELRPLQQPNSPAHPGEMVVEYLEFQGWTQSDLARRSGLTPKTISEICNGKAPITPPTALAFEKVFQRPADFWLNLQRRYDESEARRRELQRSELWTDWAAKFPLKELKKRKWLPRLPTATSDVESLLGFLGVSSPDSWSSVWQASAVAYRQTRKFKTSPEAISAWVRATELFAAEVPFEVAPFDERALRSSTDELRRMSRLRVDKALELTQAVCAKAGVVFVWVPELPHTGISGCARWLTDKKALVAISLRYKTDDQMWFTFFHEIGHILLHRKRQSFVLDNAEESVTDKVVDPQMVQYEEEANGFARDTIIPPRALGEFIGKGVFTNDSIHDFADQMQIGPGLVVGRLQHDGILEQYQGNKLKQTIDWGVSDEE